MGPEVTWNDLRSELADYVRLKEDTGKVKFASGNAFELDVSHPFDAVRVPRNVVAIMKAPINKS
jgi:2-polyprenyl-6-hydroxyphenyl methylase/3-demethylubiquinone-9 3-methyltransferase